ncbi:MAG TPA: M1 family metallopeptidase, partial [Terriglobales bacterium]
MKRALILVVWVFVCTTYAAAQRLPKLAVPENYQLTFTPDFSNDNFTGDETITLKVHKPTSEIVLNSYQITFTDATVTNSGQSQKASVKVDKGRQMATLALPAQVQPGPATIHIKYSGILNNELRGFYLSKANGRKYAVTQFESTDARRAFPSFDEPEYKATFDITIVADKGDTAISNGKIISDTPGPGEGKHTIRFSTSPKMSSYLVAVAVGDFEYIEGSADGIPIRIWATPGKQQLGTFALATAEQCLRYFNRYFSIKYPFEKLDIIAFPDFAAGAMENTAAITYREVYLLIDANHSSVSARKQVAEILAHEIAHMWFGDLVTMQWWDDIWLNEGFATWASSKPIDAWKPEWDIRTDDLLETSNSLSDDSLKSTRPIRQAAESPGEIQELFDGIAYGKAAAVLRMVEGYIGEEDFRKGVNAYLEKYSYGNATATDFWNTLTATSGKPVDKIMSSFVEQPGVPMVSVKTQCSQKSGSLTLEQKRYFYDRATFNRGSGEVWIVPVCMKTEAASKDRANCELLTSRQQTIALPACSSWVLANAGASGYYRSDYATDDLRGLGEQVESQ